MATKYGMEETSGYGPGNPGPPPDNYDKPGRDFHGGGNHAPPVPSTGAQADADAMKHLGERGAALDAGTHPERHPSSKPPDSGIEGSEHLDGQSGGEVEDE